MSFNACWLTDLHLNLAPDDRRHIFLDSLRCGHADVILVTGDTADSNSLERHLQDLATAAPVPVYLVLGNHDFYHGSIQAVRNQVRAAIGRHGPLYYLPDLGLVELTPSTCLVGVDGWSDGRAGDYWGSQVVLNDYLLIRDFAGLDRQERLSQLYRLGEEAAEQLWAVLPNAVSRFERVVVLIHPPPFVEACWHDGRPSDRALLPHFVCHAAGEALWQISQQTPTGHEIVVLCGHTHSDCEVQIAPNLVVHTGKASYGHPQAHSTFDINS
jgi:predicted phosphohydrolase